MSLSLGVYNDQGLVATCLTSYWQKCQIKSRHTPPAERMGD